MVSGHKKHVKQLLFAEGKANTNLVPRSHSVNGNVRSGKVRQYTLFHWLLKKRLRQCNLRSDLLISWDTCFSEGKVKV